MVQMKVSVIMAAYNAEKYIDEAIQSILNQTYRNFEFIIVNDGSTDSTSEIISGYNDKRIKVLHQNNQGCAAARETGIKYARGKYLAIMDADDIALPERIEKTVNYLDLHPDVVLVGTGYILKDEENNSEYIKVPHTEDLELRRILIKYDPFKDPTLLIRRSAFLAAGGYQLDHGFDYEFYARIAKFGKIANIKDVLLIVRQHKQQFFRKGISSEEHRKRRLKIRWLTLWRLKPQFSLFLKTLIWLSFEYTVHIFPQNLRHKLPKRLRDLLKANLPPKVI